MSKKKHKEGIRTTGIIDMKIYSEGGNVYYYVNVNIEGKIERVRTSPYSSRTKSLPDGKSVDVELFTTKHGEHYAEIVGEDIILCRDDMGGEIACLIAFLMLVILVIIIKI